MTIKNLLVPVGDIAHDEGAVGAALSLAADFGGHVDCLFAMGRMSEVVPAAAMGLFEAVQAQMAAEFEQDRERKRGLALQRFDEMLAERGIDRRETVLPAELPSAGWQVAEGAAPEVVAVRGAAYDMMVVGPARRDHASVGELSAEAALFRTGRPVLIAPSAPPAAIGESAVIGWNRSPSSARAVAAALPLLRRARSVAVVSVETGAKQGPPARDVARHLAWHEVEAEVVELPPDHRPVGEVLLAEAGRMEADLLVMGAYSHSRLRELVLGGVTRHVLQNAGIPVLMAH